MGKQKFYRKSIRLKGYDYSSAGFYFITICTHHRQCLFGKVVNGKMILNKYGKIATDFWHKIPERYVHAGLDKFVIMPNHIHGIIGIEFNPVGAIHELPLRDSISCRKNRRQMLLPKIIGWYKMNVAKHCNILLENTGNRFWQRNYYEHIIRDIESLYKIREYIQQNPKYWEEDKNHPDKL